MHTNERKKMVSKDIQIYIQNSAIFKVFIHKTIKIIDIECNTVVIQ